MSARDEAAGGVDMGTRVEARANLIAKAVAWREFRKPLIAGRATHKANESREREAQFQLANAAALWLWHEENRSPSPRDQACSAMMGSAAVAAPLEQTAELAPASGNEAGWRVSIVDETLVLDADNDFVATTFINRADYNENYEKRAAVALQIAALPDLLIAVREAADQFERYAAGHRAKGTPEADAKAATNDRWATYMRAASAKAGG